jgi:putative endonuclease
MVRAPALQAGGHWFKSSIAHKRQGSFRIEYLRGRSSVWLERPDRRSGRWRGDRKDDEDKLTCCLYILKSTVDQRFYIGTTANLNDRIKRHNEGRSKSTRSRRPWEVVYVQEFASRGEATARERQLKKWKNKDRIEELTSKQADR